MGFSDEMALGVESEPRSRIHTLDFKVMCSFVILWSSSKGEYFKAYSLNSVHNYWSLMHI